MDCPVHPLWWICLILRICIVYGVYRVTQSHTRESIRSERKFSIRHWIYYLAITLILTSISVGFIHAQIQSSKGEVQLAPVFWQNARWVHALLYGAAAASFLHWFIHKSNVNPAYLFLGMDVLFSIGYRYYKYRQGIRCI